MGMKRKLAFLLANLCIFLATESRALDEILLKSGTRVPGTILGQSKDQVLMRVGDGQVIYPKRAIQRIYDSMTREEPVITLMEADQLPPWWIPLADLYYEDWINKIVNIRATYINVGELKDIPYLSFRANQAYELNVYGNIKDPAAIEIGFYRPLQGQGAKKRCRQFMASYLTTIPQIKALYALSDRGGSSEVDGLTITVTPPDAADAFGGWWVLVANTRKLAASRLSDESAFWKMSDQMVSTMQTSTEGESEWKKWAFKDALNRFLPMEQVKEMLKDAVR